MGGAWIQGCEAITNQLPAGCLDSEDMRRWTQRLSGSSRVARAHQLSFLAQAPFHDTGDQVNILAGDFNLREGEDLVMLHAGWREARPPGETCTWRRGDQCARYDRIYITSSAENVCEIAAVKILSGIMGKLSDHAALYLSTFNNSGQSSDGQPRHSHQWAAEALTSVGSRGTLISGQPRHSHQWAAEALTSVGSRGTHNITI